MSSIPRLVKFSITTQVRIYTYCSGIGYKKIFSSYSKLGNVCRFLKNVKNNDAIFLLICEVNNESLNVKYVSSINGYACKRESIIENSIMSKKKETKEQMISMTECSLIKKSVLNNYTRLFILHIYP